MPYNWKRHVKKKRRFNDKSDNVNNNSSNSNNSNSNNNNNNNNNNYVKKTQHELASILNRIDGIGYGAYKQLQSCCFELANNAELYVDHVQSDPYARDSRCRLRMPMNIAGFDTSLFEYKCNDDTDNMLGDIRNIAFCDYIHRLVLIILNDDYYHGFNNRAKGGHIFVTESSQFVLKRSCVLVNNKFIELRIRVGFPAYSRRIAGKLCCQVLIEKTQKLANSVLKSCSMPKNGLLLKEHVEIVEDQEYLRNILQKYNLLAFVGNGSILPRRSGADDRPMISSNLIPFISPPSLEVDIILPNRGQIKGMGIKKSVTIIVGGGFHGKSTLLNALQYGCYNVIPCDGREFVKCHASAIKIRSEDGRSVSSVNISPFITNVPSVSGINCENFTTNDASGSTSQAASIVEAIEAKSKLLLIDEDTSATNFMIRDTRMQKLVKNDPIIPFVSKVKLIKQLYDISTILVIGGCGEYFDCADTVIMMENYEAKDVTIKAKEIATLMPSSLPLSTTTFGDLTSRIPNLASVRKLQNCKIMCSREMINFKHVTELVLNGVEQLVEQNQLYTIAKMISYLAEQSNTKQISMINFLENLDILCKKDGFSFLHNTDDGFVYVRLQDVAAALNRLRILKFISKS